MTEPIHFHTDLYRRDAVETAAQKYVDRARIEIAEAWPNIIAHLEPLSREDMQTLRDEFCNEAFSATARRLRNIDRGTRGTSQRSGAPGGPPWVILKPFEAGSVLGLGWVIEGLSPIRSGSATLSLRHEQHGSARVAIRRNCGAPLGVAHTEHFDFLLMNGGSGISYTESSIGRVLVAFAHRLRAAEVAPDRSVLEAFEPHAEGGSPQAPTVEASAPPIEGRRVAPEVDLEQRTITFDIDQTRISRLEFYDAVLALAERAHVFLSRLEGAGVRVQLKVPSELSIEDVRLLIKDATKSLNRVARRAVGIDPDESMLLPSGLPPLPPEPVDLERLLVHLEGADPMALGLDAEPDRGPGHEGLRVLNILGKGACDSDCVFCCEKFNPSNRLRPNADATRQAILDSVGQFDMLFFASGEPTINPKLFEYVDLAKSVGFTSFGMSSHFRTFADPRFALKILEAGFEYFDISLHAADIEGQLQVNPIEDGGASLAEALKGLAVLLRLADALGVRISITHKIVVSRLNVTDLERIFHSTYDRGVRHFILQPVRTIGLAPERQAVLEISEDEIIPHLNAFLEKTSGLGAAIKPYGFSRRDLFSGGHIEHEQNRVKNISGKQQRPRWALGFPLLDEQRPTDGRLWVEVRGWPDHRVGFAVDGKSVVLDEALERGVQLPFGCRMGSCGMCCARLLEGEVDQSTQLFLSEEQMQQGFVLLCQARPLSDVVVRICTDDEIDPL